MGRNMMSEHAKGKIKISKNGPYLVNGSIPLVKKTQVVTEYGEPIAWKVEGAIATTEDDYALCRCGGSQNKPFCDGSHRRNGFDGAETADVRPTTDRQAKFDEDTGIVVRQDTSLCTNAGFCGTRFRGVTEMVPDADDSETRSSIAAMVERCPSGSFVYSLGNDPEIIEPDLPRQVAATTEITEEGPINGPLWVTGNIPIERADGQPIETRNRVTLCNCGKSCNKPLCDGSHRSH